MMRRQDRFARRTVSYASETALCEVLRAHVLEDGWSPYPETSGWDLLVVREADGLQVGVHAKLRPNVDVLAQALVADREKGPDVHAVLVPSCSATFRQVAKELRLLVLEAAFIDPAYRPEWKAPNTFTETVDRAPRHLHLPGRCWVPPFMPDLPAGVPGPRQVTPWKVATAQLCARIRAGETISNRQVRMLRLDFHELELVQDRPQLYKVPAAVRLPDVDFPEVAAGLGLPVPR